MIPILYDSNATEFTNNGLGRLADCVSCLVTEERNGEYEVEFEYPITGVHYNDIIEGRIITVTHDETGDVQPFEIYSHTAPIDGVVTYHAHHLSYRLSNVILKPMTAGSVSGALAKFETETLTENPFTFWTDKTTTANFKLTYPASVRSMLGGTEGSILDVYGGEYEFDNFTVKLYANRGADNGVTIRYGKNLIDLQQEYDTLGLYSAVVPYWVDSETGESVYGGVITGRGGIIYTGTWEDESAHLITDEDNEEINFSYYQTKTTTMDFSSDFDEQPTPEELEARAAAYLEANTPWIPKENITVDFVALWQTEEYKDIAPLERVNLCDTVRIIYTALGVDATAKVIKTTWNALNEKYDAIELGEAKTSFADTILNTTTKQLEDRPTVSMMQEAIDNATTLITGGAGGHVVFSYDEDGKPNEIYVMDTEDVNTAVNVLRINVNGIGFSSNGINGTYRTAWTLDGNFVADFITTGTLNANRVRSGVLASTDGSSYWDLDGSSIRFYDKSFDSYVELDEGYISFSHGGTEFGKIYRVISGGEDALTIQSSGGNVRFTMKDYANLRADTEIFLTAGTRLLEKASDHVSLYAGEDSTSFVRAYDNGSDQFIDLNSGGNNYVRVDGKTGYIKLTTTGYISETATTFKTLTVNNSAANVYDDGTYQYIIAKSGGNTWARVDGNDDYIWLQCGQLIMNGYGGYTGTVTISGTTLTIKNGIITGVS